MRLKDLLKGSGFVEIPEEFKYNPLQEVSKTREKLLLALDKNVELVIGEGTVQEQAPQIKDSRETKELQDLYLQVAKAKKGGLGNRYPKEFESAKKRALKALNDMIMYSKIGG